MNPFRPLLDPSSKHAPKYWQHETGNLPATVLRYMRNEQLTVRDLAMMRAYLKQWVDSPVWEMNPHDSVESRRRLRNLRTAAAGARTQAQVDRCISMAVDMGMDPL